MAIVATALCRRQSPCRNRPVADYASASRLLSQYAALIMLTLRMSNHPPVLQFLGPREYIFTDVASDIFPVERLPSRTILGCGSRRQTLFGSEYGCLKMGTRLLKLGMYSSRRPFSVLRSLPITFSDIFPVATEFLLAGSFVGAFLAVWVRLLLDCCIF